MDTRIFDNDDDGAEIDWPALDPSSQTLSLAVHRCYTDDVHMKVIHACKGTCMVLRDQMLYNRSLDFVIASQGVGLAIWQIVFLNHICATLIKINLTSMRRPI